MRKQSTLAEGVVGGRVRRDETPIELVAAVCEHKFQGRIFDPVTDPTATARLREQRELWRTAGQTVVFTSGAFDLFHLNHSAFLEYSRMSAVPVHFERYDAEREGALWQELSESDRRDYTIHVLSAGLVRQVVSVDGNDSVSAKKSGDPAKGGLRPAYDWETRVRSVLSAGSEANGAGPSFLVDAVTIHDRLHPALTGTPHESIMGMGQFVSPDVWAIGPESLEIVAALEEDTTGAYNETVPILLKHRGPYMDRIVGDISTSSVVHRMIGTAAPNES
jgi:hypothetical protein